MTQSEIQKTVEHIQHIAGDSHFWDCYWSKCWIYSI